MGMYSSSDYHFSGRLFPRKRFSKAPVEPQSSSEIRRASEETAGSFATNTDGSKTTSGNKLLSRVTSLFERKENTYEPNPHIPDSPELRAINGQVETDDFFELKTTAGRENTRIPTSKAPVIVTDQFKMAIGHPEKCSYWITDHGSNKKARSYLKSHARSLSRNGATIEKEDESGFRYSQSTLDSTQRLRAPDSSLVLHQLHINDYGLIGHQRVFQVAPCERGMNFSSTDSLLLPPQPIRNTSNWQVPCQNSQSVQEMEVGLAGKVCTASLIPVSTFKEVPNLTYIVFKPIGFPVRLHPATMGITLDGQPYAFSHPRLKESNFKIPIPMEMLISKDGELFRAFRTPFTDPVKEKEPEATPSISTEMMPLLSTSSGSDKVMTKPPARTPEMERKLAEIKALMAKQKKK